MRRLLSIIALACACNEVNGGADSALAPVPNSPATLVVEVGTGASDWMPIHDGDAVSVIAGPQGGFHVWTSIRIKDSSVDSARINLTSRLEATGEPAGNPSSVATTLTLTADGAREHTGMRNFIADPTQVRGRRVALRVEAIAADGRHGAGEHIVLLQ